MIVLGIDCATHAGYARIKVERGRPELIEYGVLDLSKLTGPQITSVLFPGGDRVAIELPYLGKNAATTIKLARLCGRFEQEANRWVQASDIKVITASTWQAAILGKFGGRKRAGLKKASKLWARATFGVDMTEDESDAAGIAMWAAKCWHAEDDVSR